MRRQRQRDGAPPTPSVASTGQEIRLENPVAEHFGPFIVGNAAAWERIAATALAREAPEDWERYAATVFPDPVTGATEFRRLLTQHGLTHVVQEGTAKGQHLVLCGAGPSLAEHAAEWCPQGDQVWGCNSAATWLANHGHKVTHAFTVDQTAHMVEEWYDAPDLEYLIASTVHPHLVEHLTTRDRRVRFFHNFVGLAGRPVQWEDADGNLGTAGYEDWLYMTLYPPTVRAGNGLNSVNRAIDVALYMGFDRITLLGADCALRLKAPPPALPSDHPDYQRWLRESTIMHADGGNALASGATALTMGGEIDGRYWESKVDLIVSAVWLVKAKQVLGDRLTIVGDTLPNALMDKGQDFLDRLPHMTDSTGKRMAINLHDDPVYAPI